MRGFQQFGGDRLDVLAEQESAEAREESRLLELSPPAAVLGVEQIAFEAKERPLNLTLSTHHPTRYPLRLDQDSRTSRARV